MKRLLVPVANAHSAHRAIDYLIRRSRSDKHLSACLLHVEEPIMKWSVLIDRYAPRYQTESSDRIFSEPLRMLDRHGIEHCAYIRSGDIALTILDTAEELDCDEIVVPSPPNRLQQLWSSCTVRDVINGPRKVPVVIIT